MPGAAEEPLYSPTAGAIFSGITFRLSISRRIWIKLEANCPGAELDVGPLGTEAAASVAAA